MAKLSTLVIYDIASTGFLLLLSLTVAFARSINSDSDEHGGLDEVTPILVPHIRPRRALVFSLITIAAFTYAADAAVNIIRAILKATWSAPGPIGIVSYLLGFLAFALFGIFLSWKDTHGAGVWQRKRVRLFVVLAVVIQVAHVILAATTGYLKKHNPPGGIPERPLPPPGLYSPFLHFAIAILRLLVLLPLYPALANPYKTFVPSATLAVHQAQAAAEEGSNGHTNGAEVSAPSLLRSTETAFHSSSGLLAPKPLYGTFTPGAQPSTQQTSRVPSPDSPSSPGAAGISGHATPTKKPKVPRSGASGAGGATGTEVSLDPTWREMGQRIRRLLPHLWPRGSFKLESLALFCFLLLVIARFITFLTPATLRELVAMFDRVQTVPAESPWKLLFTYVGLRFLQGSGGLSALRDIAWAPVMQYSDRRMSQMAFEHLLNLSLAFHTRRKTGEVLRILDRGQAINHIFELILFNIVPSIVDIIVALIVFSFWFTWTLSAVVFVVMFTYVASSVALTSWRTKIRRQMNERDVITRGIHTDCLINYETVKYFGGEEHEAARYREAIKEYQALEFKVMASLNLLNLVQNFIISFGLLVGSILVATEVVNGTKQTSDFIFFITYLAQVYGPLNNLGYIYRSINQSLVDTERLFKLLDESKDVTDKPDAKDLVITNGEIEFRNVSWTYDDKTVALKGVSFKIPKGSSVALVGESGSGKSTLLRLLYRFYDLAPEQGSILIDGQDIRDVTQASLRRAIGVVPQDSVLFNNTIAYNIGYGKFGASEGELEYAAQAAQMHERILSFPLGYETRVGERGVRLSGGEKQRVCIARTFLKNAPILLLDEATSALDTTTEKDIQKALQNLLTGRSSLSIAHRLSTIANSDVIIVLKDGEIIESGSHQGLVAANGVFAAMWAEQITTEAEHQKTLDIPTEDPKSPVTGYDVIQPPPPSAPDFTDTSIPRQPIVPTNDVTNPTLAHGPVIVPDLLNDLPVASREELAARAAELNAPEEVQAEDAAVEVPPPIAEAVTAEAAETAPSLAPEDPKDTASVDTRPSYAAVVAAPAPAEPAEGSIAAESSTKPEVEEQVEDPAPEEPSAATAAPIAFPSSEEPEEAVAEVTSKEPSVNAAPVAFPSEETKATEPVSFPQSNTPDNASINTTPATPGIKFVAAAGPPSRPGTPDSSAEAKRKRTTSQSLQRLARRISLGGRRSSSQAAEAARATELTRSDSQSGPIESFVSKITKRGSISISISKDESSSLKGGADSVKGAESLKGTDESPSGRETPAGDEAESREPSGSGSGKIKKKQKKGKK